LDIAANGDRSRSGGGKEVLDWFCETVNYRFVKFLQTIVVVSIFALVGLCSAHGGVSTNDLEKLQGEWSMVSGVTDGEPIPDYVRKSAKRVCKGNQIAATAGGQLILKATITLDSTKSPKTIDYDVTDGPNKGKKQLGIYEIDGDTFKSCFAAPGAERPTNFESKPGDLRTSTVWKRKAEQSQAAK
jgi:uncharacterized protein (TIGR03067 family)